MVAAIVARRPKRPSSPYAAGGILQSSRDNEWYTPPGLLADVRRLFGGVIDLDPCADPARRVPARIHYTQAEDGLAHPWSGRVFVNPPYGRALPSWTRKFVEDEHLLEGVLLVPARTETRWFQPLWRLPALCFLGSRVHFLRPDGSRSAGSGAPFPVVLAYRGARASAFAVYFRAHGTIITPWIQQSRQARREEGW